MRPEPVHKRAEPGRASLIIGRVAVDPPVVLAPMAGITNAAFRQLCREQTESRPAVLRRSERTRFSSAGDDEVGELQCDSRERSEQSNSCAGLYVCEMITSRGLVERDRKTLSMLQFDPGERIRSVQLYGVDAAIMAQATEILCNEYGVDHVDLNFGCPVPKVTRKGGGAALPYKRARHLCYWRCQWSAMPGTRGLRRRYCHRRSHCWTR